MSKKNKSKNKKEVSLSEGTFNMPAITGKKIEWIAECHRNCKESKDISFRISVLLTPKAIASIKTAMVKFPAIEWLGTLHGEKLEDKSIGYTTYIVKDIKLSEQQEQGITHARSLTIPEEDTLGTVHSHHTMGAFASSEDREAALNWGIIMIVSYTGTKAYSAIELPCGKMILQQCEVVGNDALTHALEEQKDNILRQRKEQERYGTFLMDANKNSTTMIPDEDIAEVKLFDRNSHRTYDKEHDFLYDDNDIINTD